MMVPAIEVDLLRVAATYFWSAYRGQQPLAILLGGTTALEQDLSRVRCPVLGVNQSFRLGVTWPRTVAHLISGRECSTVHVHEVRQLWPKMPTFMLGWPGHATPKGVITMRQAGAFSLNLAEQGVYCMGASVMALQLAVWLGFNDIRFIGLDLKRRGERLKSWDAKPNPYDASRDYAHQLQALRQGAEILKAKRPAVRVINTSHDTACDAFPIVPFDEAFA